MFGFGVASGDPTATEVLLWTRVTPILQAVPGSGLGPPSRVGWEVAADEEFTQVLRTGIATTDAGRDHTVKVVVSDLDAVLHLGDYLYEYGNEPREAGVLGTRGCPAGHDRVRVLVRLGEGVPEDRGPVTQLGPRTIPLGWRALRSERRRDATPSPVVGSEGVSDPLTAR